MTTLNKPLSAALVALGLISGSAEALVPDDTPATRDAAPISAAPIDADPVDDEPSASSEGSARNQFPASYFDQYAPRTALDMVNQIPGFSIRTGDLGKRGLGQGGANILINGERLTGKANPFDELEQILSANVVSIQIRDGAALSIPGLSGQVADITTKADSFSGSWEWNPEFRDGLQPNWTNGRVNISGELGRLAWSAFARDFAFRGGADGTELRRTATGELFETRRQNIDNYGDRPGVGANLTWKPREGHTANLNAEYSLFNFRRKVEAVRQPATARGDDSLTLSEFGEDERYYEIGADYELPLLGGTFKAIGYVEREASPTLSTFSLYDPRSGFTGASRFRQEADEAETIARGEYSWVPSEGRSWQVGAEAAFNSLDVEQELAFRDPGEDFISDSLSSFLVEEDRFEATLTHSRPIGSLDVQASIGAEYSKLSQMRDDAPMTEAREFVRPKGFVSASYSPQEGRTWRARLEREVGQLNFFDFVASVDLVDDLGRDGNPDLVPAQSWLGSLEYQRDFGDGNTFTIEAYGALISDIVDRIPVGLDGDAIGNLDSATRYGIDFTGTLKGDRWGWEGTQLDLTLEWRDSDLDDPLLGFSRRINGDQKWEYVASFRHDIPNTDWAYGGFVERFIGAEQFRTFTIGRFGNTKPFTGVFVEHKDLLGIKARVRLLNPIGAAEFSERTVFDGRRDRNVIDRLEDATYRFGELLQVRLSGEF